MTNAAAIKARFLQDAPSLRLGNLAANLARVQTFASDDSHRDVVANLIEESAFFVEWAAPDADHETQLVLLDLQRKLLGWRRDWSQTWEDHTSRTTVAEMAGQWSLRLLRIAGLLPE